MKKVDMKWIVILGVIVLGQFMYHVDSQDDINMRSTSIDIGKSEETGTKRMVFYSSAPADKEHDISFVLFTDILEAWDEEGSYKFVDEDIKVRIGGSNRLLRRDIGTMEIVEDGEQLLVGEVKVSTVKINGENYDLDNGRIFFATRQEEGMKVVQMVFNEDDKRAYPMFVNTRSHREEIESLSRYHKIFDELYE